MRAFNPKRGRRLPTLATAASLPILLALLAPAAHAAYNANANANANGRDSANFYTGDALSVTTGVAFRF